MKKGGGVIQKVDGGRVARYWVEGNFRYIKIANIISAVSNLLNAKSVTRKTFVASHFFQMFGIFFN